MIRGGGRLHHRTEHRFRLFLFDRLVQVLSDVDACIKMLSMMSVHQRDSRRFRQMPAVHNLLCALTLRRLPGNRVRRLEPFFSESGPPNGITESSAACKVSFLSSRPHCGAGFAGFSRFFLHLHETISGAQTLAFLFFWRFGAGGRIPFPPFLRFFVRPSFAVRRPRRADPPPPSGTGGRRCCCPGTNRRPPPAGCRKQRPGASPERR